MSPSGTTHLPVILVDSTVLLDVASEDPTGGGWSARTLAAWADRVPLLINPIVYAEDSVGYEYTAEVDAALPPELHRRDALPWEAAFLAGKAFLRYLRRGGDRRSPLPDFYIGAHAVVRGLARLTRDAGRYRTYFPDLRVIAPGSGELPAR